MTGVLSSLNDSITLPGQTQGFPLHLKKTRLQLTAFVPLPAPSRLFLIQQAKPRGARSAAVIQTLPLHSVRLSAPTSLLTPPFLADPLRGGGGGAGRPGGGSQCAGTVRAALRAVHNTWCSGPARRRTEMGPGRESRS